MCGQAGAFCTTPLSLYEINKVRKLLIANSFRGTDSTGVMWWKKLDNEFGVRKEATHPFIFNYSTIYKDLLEDEWKAKAYPHLFSIHCRAATVGKVETANAHPFENEKLIGMHNGTISANFDNKKDFETDSEALYHNIATMGLKGAIDQLNIGSPAYALVWMDKEKQTLNFLKNGMRPLHIFHGGTTLYWSSDAKDLTWVVDEAVTESKAKNGCTLRKVLTLKNDLHYELKLDQSGEIDYDATEVKPAPKVYAITQHGGRGSNSGDFFRERLGKTTTVTEGVTCSVAKHDYDKMFEEMATNGYYTRPNNGVMYQYALEYDSWFCALHYSAIQLWRLFHPREFRKLAAEEWNAFTKQRQQTVLGWMQISRKDLKRLLRGRNNDYLVKPFRIAWNGDKQRVNFYEIDIKMAKNAFEREKEQKDSNVIEVPFEEVDHNTYTCGVDNIECDRESVEELLDKGCTFCSDPVSFDDLPDLFWMTNMEFLCPCCQDKVIDGVYDTSIVGNAVNLYDFVQNRIERAVNESKLVIIN